MPQGKHSTIQGELVTTINLIGKPQHTARAFPELHCTFGGRSVLADIAIFSWGRIPLDDQGDIANTFEKPPDWMIAILSSEQSTMQMTGGILHSLSHGCQMGWLIDPNDKTVVVYPLGKQPMFLDQPDHPLPVPDFISGLELSLGTLFGWLKAGSR